MLSVDHAVLAGVALLTPASARVLWRSGWRGGSLIALSWLAFHGVVLFVAMTAHTLDVLTRVFVGTGHDGAPFPYDFRAYALFLLGTVLMACGAVLVWGAAQLSGGGKPSSGRRPRTER